MKTKNIFVGIGIILIVLVVWGLIGSSFSSDIGTSCDIGIGDDGSSLCWTWHRNAVGDIQDNLEDIFGK